MTSIVELAPFAARSTGLLQDHAKQMLHIRLAQYPDAGEEIEDASGWREVRWADRTGSKRGGVRTVRYRLADSGRVYLGDVYARNDKTVLSDDDKAVLAKGGDAKASAKSKDAGERLSAAAAEMGKIESGKATPAREASYDGAIYMEQREKGKSKWTLTDARAEDPTDLASLREGLRQTPEGLAALLGVRLSTIRSWSQGRRKPRGAAARLMQLAATRPEVLLGLED